MQTVMLHFGLATLASAIFLGHGQVAEERYWIAEIKSKFKAVAVADEQAPQVLFPLPRDYRGQVPLSFKLTFKQRGAIVDAHTTERPSGDRVLEITLTPLKKGKWIEIEWTATVLTQQDESFAKLPKTAPFPESYPDDVKSWLSDSTYVQSTHPRILAEARKLKGTDVIETINRTATGCLKLVQNHGEMLTEASAVLALDHCGSCTSNANLMAALLRANKIPARILSGYPTWAKVPYQTHYIVEAYVDGFGWYPIESTLGMPGWICMNMPIFSIVTVENENRGKGRLGIGAGVPYLSLTESGPNMATLGTLEEIKSDHSASLTEMVRLPASIWPELQTRWRSWLKKSGLKFQDLESAIKAKE